MTIKLDENLPERLVAELSALGHDVDTVRAEHLAGHDDTDVRRGAQTAGRFLITQDLDFSDVRRYAPGTHAGLLLVRLREPGVNALLQQVGRVFQDNPPESWARCFVVLTEHKLRVKRP